MNTQPSSMHTFRGLLLVAIATAACAAEPGDATDGVEQAVTASHRAQIKKRVLTVTGTPAGSRLALRVGATGLLEVDVGDDGTADFRFDRSAFEAIVVDAAGGDDTVRIDESGGIFTDTERTTLMGGDGDDTLLGGSGNETFFGGKGNDFVDGGRGVDVASLGDGNDTFQWLPGQGSDVVDGEAGADTMLFFGANIGEIFDVAATSEGRVTFTRDIGTIVMDLDAVERIDVRALGGADRLVVHDVTGTALARVDVDLAARAGDVAGDTVADTVVYDGSDAADVIDVAVEDGATVAAGVGAEVAIAHADLALDRLVLTGTGGDAVNVNGSAAADTMTVIDDAGAPAVLVDGANLLVVAPAPGVLSVNALGGDDALRALGSVQVPVRLDGGDGNDIIVGGPFADLLLGGAGDDTIDGGFGNDVVLLGGGNDTGVWNPGGASDVIEGEDGDDTLLFAGSNIAEKLELNANGARLRLTRDVGGVVMDVAGVERAQLLARGGEDDVQVHDLRGTAVATVDVDLAAIPGTGGGDSLRDVVTVAATTATASADGATIIAGGLGATVNVTGGEASSLAVDVLAVNGPLTVNASEGPDVIAVFGDAALTGVKVDHWTMAIESLDLSLNCLGGDDVVQATAVTAPVRIDGGDGNDAIVGGAANDVLVGGNGDDFINGARGADIADLGTGEDTFVWNPGDGSDVVEGGGGVDTMIFNGANIAEEMELTASGPRLRLARNIGGIVMDTDGVERVAVRVLSGEDTLTVNDLTGTAVDDVRLDLSASTGGPDLVVDAITINGTEGADSIAISEGPGEVTVTGLAAAVHLVGADGADQLSIHGRGGDDALLGLPIFGIGVSFTQD